ncbi:MAG: hypothetical protein ACT4PL_01905 [Phycisphaerales bacterium]
MASAADKVDELFKLMTEEQRAAARADALGIGPSPAVRAGGGEPPTPRRPATEAAAAEVAAPVPVVPTAPPTVPGPDRSAALRNLASAIVPEGASAALLQAMQAAAAASNDQAAAARLSELDARLSPTEKNVLAAFQAILTAAADPASKSEADWAKLLSENAAALSQAQGVMITRALLCRRVEAFGKYTEFASRAFIGGRVQPLLVYVELDHFSHRPHSAESLLGPVAPGEEDTRFEVELAQRIEVRTDTGTLVHLERETRTRDLSRQKRREFYTVQRVDLPQTLALGAYVVKVSVRDLHTGAEAEQVIPITIVTSAAAAAGPER